MGRVQHLCSPSQACLEVKVIKRGTCIAQVAFLDLRKADVPAGAGLVSSGPKACLSGQLQLIQGQLGMSSQVCPEFLLFAGLQLLLASLNEREGQASGATS